MPEREAGARVLPVLLRVPPPPGATDPGQWVTRWLNPRSAGWLAALLACATIFASVQAQTTAKVQPGVLATMWKWTPLILWGPKGEIGGFLLNVLVSFLVMAIGTVLGLLLGLAAISPRRAVRRTAWLITQVFRNSPWLVLLFYVMLMVPFGITVFGTSIPLPGWLKATVALSLPIMANLAEVFRGAVSSLPSGQWEAAESLAFNRRHTLWRIIIPQCIKRMIPPWMNWYAILTMSTPLISIVGVHDAMQLTQDALSSIGRSEMLIPMYLWLLSWFFAYNYPIAAWTRRLERRYAVRQ